MPSLRSFPFEVDCCPEIGGSCVYRFGPFWCSSRFLSNNARWVFVCGGLCVGGLGPFWGPFSLLFFCHFVWWFFACFFPGDSVRALFPLCCLFLVRLLFFSLGLFIPLLGLLSLEKDLKLYLLLGEV